MLASLNPAVDVREEDHSVGIGVLAADLKVVYFEVARDSGWTLGAGTFSDLLEGDFVLAVRAPVHAWGTGILEWEPSAESDDEHAAAVVDVESVEAEAYHDTLADKAEVESLSLLVLPVDGWEAVHKMGICHLVAGEVSQRQALQLQCLHMDLQLGKVASESDLDVDIAGNYDEHMSQSSPKDKMKERAVGPLKTGRDWNVTEDQDEVRLAAHF